MNGNVRDFPCCQDRVVPIIPDRFGIPMTQHHLGVVQEELEVVSDWILQLLAGGNE